MMISARDRFIQIKFLHRAYFSPQCLARIYPDNSPACPKCASEEGSFFVWSCQHIQTFWRGVVNIININSVSKLKVPCDPIPLLLGIVDTLEAPQSKKLFVFYAAFYARKAILLQWKGTIPPMIQQWKTLINKALPFYKLTYIGRNCPLLRYGSHGFRRSSYTWSRDWSQEIST